MGNLGYCRIIVEALSILLFRMDDSGTFAVILFRKALSHVSSNDRNMD